MGNSPIVVLCERYLHRNERVNLVMEWTDTGLVRLSTYPSQVRLVAPPTNLDPLKIPFYIQETDEYGFIVEGDDDFGLFLYRESDKRKRLVYVERDVVEFDPLDIRTERLSILRGKFNEYVRAEREREAREREEREEFPPK